MSDAATSKPPLAFAQADTISFGSHDKSCAKGALDLSICGLALKKRSVWSAGRIVGRAESAGLSLAAESPGGQLRRCGAAILSNHVLRCE